jgi:hypothetical protein
MATRFRASPSIPLDAAIQRTEFFRQTLWASPGQLLCGLPRSASTALCRILITYSTIEDIPMADLRMFKLVESLEAGRSARAQLLNWDGERYVEENLEVLVFDYIGETGLRGERGYCFFSEISERWEVLNGLLAVSRQPML